MNGIRIYGPHQNTDARSWLDRRQLSKRKEFILRCSGFDTMWRIQPHANQRDGESEAGRRTSPARADPNRPYGIIILPRCRDWACFPSSIPITMLPPCSFVSAVKCGGAGVQSGRATYGTCRISFTILAWIYCDNGNDSTFKSGKAFGLVFQVWIQSLISPSDHRDLRVVFA